MCAFLYIRIACLQADDCTPIAFLAVSSLSGHHDYRGPPAKLIKEDECFGIRYIRCNADSFPLALKDKLCIFWYASAASLNGRFPILLVKIKTTVNNALMQYYLGIDAWMHNCHLSASVLLWALLFSAELSSYHSSLHDSLVHPSIASEIE